MNIDRPEWLARPNPLTEKERTALVWAAEGLTTKQIAQQMGISPHTIKDHLTSAMRRLGAVNRTQAVLIAVRTGQV